MCQGLQSGGGHECRNEPLDAIQHVRLLLFCHGQYSAHDSGQVLHLRTLLGAEEADERLPQVHQPLLPLSPKRTLLRGRCDWRRRFTGSARTVADALQVRLRGDKALPASQHLYLWVNINANEQYEVSKVARRSIPVRGDCLPPRGGCAAFPTARSLSPLHGGIAPR